MPHIGGLVVMGSVLKPHVFKFCLLLVMMLLGFNACVLFHGWPGPGPKYTDTVTNKERHLVPLHSFGQPSQATATTASTTLVASINHFSATNLSKALIPSKKATPPTATAKSTNKTPLSVSVPSERHKLLVSFRRNKAKKNVSLVQEYYHQLTEDKFRKKSSPNHLVDRGMIRKVLQPPRRRCSCREKLCLDCLHPDDVKFYNSCLRDTRKIFKNMTATEMEGNCHFMEGRHRAAVGLVSYMGSGNTWVRGLLEISTGVCTGAVYCDKDLRRAGMNGERVHSGSVLVTKTHFLNNVIWTDHNKPVALYFPKMQNNRYHPAYSSAIFLIRNPFDAIISEFIRFSYTYARNVDSHTVPLTNHSYFGNNSRWNQFVHTVAAQWGEYFPVWLVEPTNSGRPILVVKYEDLISNTVLQVKRMLDFLKFPYTEEDLQKKLKSNRYDIFRRIHVNDDFDHYTRDQRLLINRTISDTLEYLRSNYTSTLGIEKYLWYG